MKTYDDIVVGSGASGLASALILALNGRRVLLLEKGPRIGGSLARFERGGVPFDTGFHFTGGFARGGILDRMLELLGLRERVPPVFLPAEHAHIFRMEPPDREFVFPSGIDRHEARMKDYFPGERHAVAQYFDLLRRVRAETVSMDVARLTEANRLTDLDYVTLRQVIDELTPNELLKAVFCGLCMCHGTKPSEISFANHARVCFDMYEATARIQGGGETLIEAFRDRLQALNVEIRCRESLAECLDVRENRAHAFRLASGEEVAASDAILTLHPADILRLLPASSVSRAFRDRVESFEPSAGFFTVYATLPADAGDPPFDSSIVSLFPLLDFDRMLDPGEKSVPALVIVPGTETSGSGTVRTVTAFEPSFARHVEAWKDSRIGRRPPGYAEYKAASVERIFGHMARHYPGFVPALQFVDSASVLTFRDYLHSPEGAAYGIKQKIGQFNLLGKLPVRNLYAAGQSSLLPGLAGAMMSAFVVCRSMLGREAYSEFVSRNLCSRSES